MPIFAENKSKPIELVPAGNHIGRAFQMIQIGTITEVIMGKTVTHSKVRIGWELPAMLKVFKEENGKQPYIISQEYTLSMHEKSSMRKMLASWRGKDFTEEEAKKFDITKLLGIPCLLNIIHKPKKTDPSSMYQAISGITPVPKGMKVPAQINKTFLLAYDNFDYDLYNQLPDFIKTTMQTSQEYRKLNSPGITDVAQDEYDFLNSGQPDLNGDNFNDLPF
jgi:hypothetical protein